MVSKTVTYEDYNGNQVTETCRFQLTRAELTKMEVNAEGGSMSKWLEKIIDTKNNRDIMEAFDMMLRASYGVRTEDGRFKKSPALLEDFVSSGAYDTIFMELITSEKEAAAFVNGIMPPLGDDLKNLGGKDPRKYLADKIAETEVFANT